MSDIRGHFVHQYNEKRPLCSLLFFLFLIWMIKQTVKTKQLYAYLFIWPSCRQHVLLLPLLFEIPLFEYCGCSAELPYRLPFSKNLDLYARKIKNAEIKTDVRIAREKHGPDCILLSKSKSGREERSPYHLAKEGLHQRRVLLQRTCDASKHCISKLISGQISGRKEKVLKTGY